MIKKLQSKIHVVEKFKIFGAVGLIFALLGAISLAVLPFGANFFNLDIDFAGGTTMTINMHKSLDKAELDKIASIVEEATGVKVSSAQKASDANADGTLAVIKSDTLSPELRDKAYAALKAEYNLAGGVAATVDADAPTVDLVPVDAETASDAEEATDAEAPAEEVTEEVSDLVACDNVDPVMGNDLRDAAIVAAGLAILLMLVYIAIRFDVRSGIAAIVALLHDVLVVMGAYVVLQIPLNMTFIAVVLTILGYSINATIVIFDRVRENRKIIKRTSFDDIVNMSVWQTATRSINTTVTTLLSITMIAIFGVESVSNFAIPLVAGIIAGLYSSMFISGPIWAKLTNNSKKK